jgi:hypothetical protein
MKRRVILLVTAIVLVSLVVVSGLGVAPFFTKQTVPPAQTWSGMPPVIVVSGSNYEMGYQCGEQAADLIYHNHMLTWSRLVSVYGEEGATKDMEVWAYYLWKYNPGLKDWLKGMSAGCKAQGYKVSALQIAAISLYPTQLWARPDAPYPDETGYGAIAQASANSAGAEEYHSCSAFAAMGNATADGKPVVAVTKMVPLETAQCFILVAFPDDGPSFVTCPQAGQPAANAGMNSAGFAEVQTAIFGPLAWSYPIEGYFHYLPQYCESVAEALEYLESCPRGGVMGSVTMADAEGNITTFEGTAPEYAIREPGDAGELAPFLVQTNHLVNSAMQAYNPPGWQVWNRDSYIRYATFFEYASGAATTGAIDFEFLKAVYSSDDWYDPDADMWHYNEPGSVGLNDAFPGSVSQAILFPADLTAYFEIGTPSGIGFPGGATGEYVKLQLADDPAEVTANAQNAALGFYIQARNLLEHELNDGAPYLTYSIAQSLEEMLDEAALEYDRGMDRAAFASMAGVDGVHHFYVKNEQMALWGEALTHYAKTQLYAQMVITQLENMAP